jgi:predicted DNA-binding transcriptional regulator YafY
MAVNKNALIRYKTIDKCLQNRYRNWTLEDLIEACSDALYEYEGIDKGVSKRTVQADIQMMRSDKLGYYAPIIVVDKKYYTYEDPDYSITNIPLTEQDLGRLTEAVQFMKQFQGFSHFKELDGMVQKLEDHIYSHKTEQQPVIDFEKNESLKGLEYLDQLYQAIIKKKALKITYQSFKARSANSFVFHPYLLKEFRNRWFVIGTKGKHKNLLNLALDRIIQLEATSTPLLEPKDPFNAEEYFSNAIGVSVSKEAKVYNVVFFVSHAHAPYIETKPLHKSQKVMERDKFGVTFSIKVQHNYELEKELLSYGESLKVLEPPFLKRRLFERLNFALDQYKSELSPKGLKEAFKKLKYKGFTILNHVYTTKELNTIKRFIEQGDILDKHAIAKRQLLNTHPKLSSLLFNKNLLSVIRAIDPQLFVTKAILFDKNPQKNWYVTWHQDMAINVKEITEREGFKHYTQKDGIISVIPPVEVNHHTITIRIYLDTINEKNGALQVIPGTHKKQLSDAEKQLITENTNPQQLIAEKGSIALLKPLLLHKSATSTAQKRRRVIHLELSSKELPKGLQYSEQLKINVD